MICDWVFRSTTERLMIVYEMRRLYNLIIHLRMLWFLRVCLMPWKWILFTGTSSLLFIVTSAVFSCFSFYKTAFHILNLLVGCPNFCSFISLHEESTFHITPVSIIFVHSYILFVIKLGSYIFTDFGLCRDSLCFYWLHFSFEYLYFVA